MATENVSVRNSPKTVASKALAIMRRAKLSGFKLIESTISQRGDGFVAHAKWEDGGFLFGSSAEISVEARKSCPRGAEVAIT